VIEEAFGELAPLTSTKTACTLLGLSRSSLYRRRHPSPWAPPRGLDSTSSPAELADADAHAICQTAYLTS
jgi:hypothetical protein